LEIEDARISLWPYAKVHWRILLCFAMFVSTQHIQHRAREGINTPHPAHYNTETEERQTFSFWLPHFSTKFTSAYSTKLAPLTKKAKQKDIYNTSDDIL